MDPVVALACRIGDAEASLNAACKLNQVAYTLDRAEAIVRALAEIRALYEELFHTSPTSFRGAAEQLRFASERLPYSHAGHAQGLCQIAQRFAAGHAMSSDLIWVRALTRSLRAASCGGARDIAAMLLQSAADTVARPSVIHRALAPSRPRVLCLPRLEEDRLPAINQPGGAISSVR